MIKLYTCIQSEHDVTLLALTVLVCAFGSWVSAGLFDRSVRSRSASFDWVAIAGLAGGTTIWSTHFIAMLGYAQQYVATFAATATILSLLCAIITTTAAVAVARLGRGTWYPEVGGAILGAGGSLMHRVGMYAYEPAGFIFYDESFSLAAIVTGAVVGCAAMSCLVRMQRPGSKLLCALLVFVCIAGLHFIAMAGVRIVPFEAMGLNGLSRDSLAIAVFVISCLVIAAGLFVGSIDERNAQRASRDVDFASHHDRLTGLPNRAACEGTTDEIIAAAGRDSRNVVICKINIASLHEVNDVLGSAGGDGVLIEVSRRLKAAILGTGLVARLSGTRFAVVARCRDVAEAQALANSLSECLALPVQLQNGTTKPRFRMGVVMFPRDGIDQRSLMANANVALERARRQPGNAICFYDEIRDTQIHRNRKLSQDLQQAIELNELELHFQPQCDLATMKIAGFEGLLRWRHAQLGCISPAEFIPIAEQTGLIVPIGHWVLREGCRIAASWPADLKVALNLSPVQLKSPDVKAAVLEAVEASGLSFERLELEITESTLMESPEESLQEMQSLQDLGISIALDDFGSGYSSLATLCSFAFNKIKLDKSFLDEKKPELQARAVLGALLKIGQTLGIRILAEGIETDQQLAFLQATGCDFAQGYLIGKPMPADRIAEWISDFEQRQAQAMAATARLRSAG